MLCVRKKQATLRRIMAGNLVNGVLTRSTVHVTIDNAKRVSVLLVICFTVYHGVMTFAFKEHSCKWLLTDGQLTRGKMSTWIPYGCTMYSYKELEAQSCFRRRTTGSPPAEMDKVLFLGDHPSLLAIAKALAKNLGMKEDVGLENDASLELSSEELRMSIKYERFTLEDENIWSSYFQKFLRDKPTLVVTSGLAMKAAGAEELASYRRLLSSWALAASEYLHSSGGKTRLLWMTPSDSFQLNETINHNKGLSNADENDESYKTATMDVLRKYPLIEVWDSARLVNRGLLEVVQKAQAPAENLEQLSSDINTQILLNLYCNDMMNFDDGTCCRPVDKTTLLQKISLALLVYCATTWLVLNVWKIVHSHNKRPNRGLASSSATSAASLPPALQPSTDTEASRPSFLSKISFSMELHEMLLRFGLIMLFAFICDHTTLFPKVEKHFTPLNFWLPITGMGILGICTTKKSKFTQFLHRDQTDEWKGWMQLAILIYHITGASKIIPIYMHMRVLVSAYLFLTGYGHFTYFWKKGDFGFNRFFQILFRLNFLTLALCFVMNQSYQLYYFVPLITFWYIVVFITLALPPRVTAASAETNKLHYVYAPLKLGVLIIVTAVANVLIQMVPSRGSFKSFLRATPLDNREWWFRLSLDQYSTTAGCLFAFGYQMALKYNLLNDKNSHHLWAKHWTAVATTGSVLGIGAYAAFAFNCSPKPACNEAHPYIFFVPVIGYIVLRNVFGPLRTRFSTSLAWFGKISLELFIAQYHVWMAADAKMILVLVPGSQTVNILVTSFILVCLAHELQQITSYLAPLVVPAGETAFCRNVVLSLTIITAGMLMQSLL